MGEDLTTFNQIICIHDLSVDLQQNVLECKRLLMDKRQWSRRRKSGILKLN